MANYYSHFVVAIKAPRSQADYFVEAVRQYVDATAAFGSQRNFEAANTITKVLLKQRPPVEFCNPGIEASFRSGDGGEEFLWVQDETGAPDFDFTAGALQLWLKHFNRPDVIGFEWSNTCSTPRLDAYGGGAVVVSAVGIRWLSTHQWLEQELRESSSEALVPTP